MNWTKLGKIFDPADHALGDGCREFAQSPQVLTCGEDLRIYFSTRSVDQINGKFLSRIAYVDMRGDFSKIKGVSDHTVIPLGDLGCFDEHGIFPLSPVRVGDLVYAYTCGWSRRVSVSVETAIGLAISNNDGKTFAKVGNGPVLSASLHEPCLVGDGFVRFFNGLFHMWYIFGTGWRKYTPDGQPERIYKIAHAISDDGINWSKEEGRRIISDKLGEDECQALPSVIRTGDRYHMFFCYREAFDFRTGTGRGYRIGHAWSDDLHTWIRSQNDICGEGEPGDWDGEMQCYPHVFEHRQKIYLLYNGNRFGRHGFGLAVLEE